MSDTVEAKVPPRSVKPSRWITVVCPHCGETHDLDRAIAAPCPLCEVTPGQPCIDLRSKARGKIVPLSRIHQVRVTQLGLLNQFADGELDEELAAES